MPSYYWELDFSEDTYKYPAMWIGQKLMVCDGEILYEAARNTEYSWQETYELQRLTSGAIQGGRNRAAQGPPSKSI